MTKGMDKKVYIIPIVAFFVFSMLLEVLVGVIWTNSSDFPPIVLPPNTRVNYERAEFAFWAQTNSLGFRGREMSPTKLPGRCRILAIGDSFTYGTGVDLEHTWPSILEELLRERSVNAQVANLGRPSAGPSDYVVVAERSLPLDADIVLVAVLQLDDLAQAQSAETTTQGLAEGENAEEEPDSGFSVFPFTVLYPNIISLLENRPTVVSAETLRREWEDAAYKLYERTTREELARFERLDNEVKEPYFSGTLNPFLVSQAVRSPQYLLSAHDLSLAQTQESIAALTMRFSQIADIYPETPLVIVSVPYKVSVSERDLEATARLGYDVTPEMLESSAADDAIAVAAEAAGIPFVSVTDVFRSHPQEDALYYELDNHFNAAGNDLFAEAVAPKIESEILDACA